MKKTKHPGRRPALLPLEQRILSALSQRALSAKAIAARAGVGRRDRERLQRELERLRRAGKVTFAAGEYALPDRGEAACVEATVTNVHDRFGFARRDETGEEFFVPGRLLAGALPGDRVRLRSRASSGGLREGAVEEILEQKDYTFTGVFRRAEGDGAVQADGGMKGEMRVDPGQRRGARDGDKVVARVCRRGERHRDHRAQIVAVTGPAQDARACAAAILLARGVHPDFEAPVLREAERLSRAGITQGDLAGRLDLRGEMIFTIDAAHSKDLDDAVSLSPLPQGGWALGVHIADVSHYVAARGALDQEAYERGTSIYYADQVVPMLPPALSNGICSLNPGEDRLALSALLTLDAAGDIVESRLQKSVIRSRVKGVYEEINCLLSDAAGPEIRRKYAPFEGTLREMDALAKRLRRSRAARGAIDLSSVETALDFDAQGKVCGVSPRASGAAESLIEEFMLLANQAAAAFGAQRELPFLYRVHDQPPEEKAEALFDLLARLGVAFTRPKGDVTPKFLSGILESVRGGELEAVVNQQILRAMAKARYSEANTGHFGLTLRRYSHFTSPIRRYPDLCIHRIISASLAGEDKGALRERYGAFVHAAAEQSSEREVRAMNIERDCTRCFLAQYMAGHLGEAFPGIVSGAAPHGLYVALENGVEGLVPVMSLPEDAYDFDGAVSLTGRRTGARYRVGDAMRVLAVRADVSSGQVDFSPVSDKG